MRRQYGDVSLGEQCYRYWAQWSLLWSVTGLYIIELFNVHLISYFHLCASEITAIPYNKLIFLFFINVGELWGSAPKFKSLNYGTKTVCLLSWIPFRVVNISLHSLIQYFGTANIGPTSGWHLTIYRIWLTSIWSLTWVLFITDIRGWMIMMNHRYVRSQYWMRLFTWQHVGNYAAKFLTFKISRI